MDERPFTDFTTGGGGSEEVKATSADASATMLMSEQVARMRALLELPTTTGSEPGSTGVTNTLATLALENEMRRVMGACGVDETKRTVMLTHDGLDRMLAQLQEEVEAEKELAALDNAYVRLDYECTLLDTKLARLKGNIDFIDAGWLDEEEREAKKDKDKMHDAEDEQRESEKYSAQTQPAGSSSIS